MPATGGFSPSPESYGGGELNSSKPLLQLIFESLAAARGSAYDQTTNSIVGVENLGLAKAICYDGWGPAARLANQFIPATMTADGLLPRWEQIFAVPPNPGDPEPVRRARVAAAWARVGEPNSLQPVKDAMQAALGPLYVGITHQTIANALSYVNGVSGVLPVATTPQAVTITGTAVAVDMIQVKITGTGGIGASTYAIFRNGTSIQTGTTTLTPIAIAGTLLTLQFVPGTYTNGDVYTMYTDPNVLWSSTLAHVDVQVTQHVNGYQNADGSPNAAFYNLVANITPILDEMLPSWATFDWYVNSSHGGIGFFLDEPDLDLEALRL